MQEVAYLRHIPKPGKILPLNDNISAISNFPIPTCKKSLKRLLGQINYYHKFIPKITQILHPLINLLKPEKKFNWDEKCSGFSKKIKYVELLNLFCKITLHQKHAMFPQMDVR